MAGIFEHSRPSNSPGRHASLLAPDHATSTVLTVSSPTYLQSGRPPTSYSQADSTVRSKSKTAPSGLDLSLDTNSFIPSTQNGIDRANLINFSPMTDAPMGSSIANHTIPDTAFDFTMTDPDFPDHLDSDGRPDGLIMPETSPSFQGDEIDAIFHEMAHLDTNEWTDERALGLKEFGFSDDSTFQAFCNDPERLMVPPPLTSGPGAGKSNTLSSESQTWMFAGAD